MAFISFISSSLLVAILDGIGLIVETKEHQILIWNLLFHSAGYRTRDLQDTEWMLYHETTGPSAIVVEV